MNLRAAATCDGLSESVGVVAAQFVDVDLVLVEGVGFVGFGDVVVLRHARSTRFGWF